MNTERTASYLFGIDGGGTRSRIGICDGKGKFLARLEGYSTNIYSVTEEEAFGNLKSLISEALQQAGLTKEDITSGCLGSAGLGRTREQELFKRWFEIILPKVPVKLCTDGEILLCGGLQRLEGFCLITGTGSIALGRRKDCSLVRAGGLGYLLGDEGAAAWIGRCATARSLRSLEGRDHLTTMLPVILRKVCLKEPQDLVWWIHHDADKSKVAALAPIVTEAARQGDELALDILQTGAAELALLVKSVVERTPDISNKELVLAGGVIEHDEILSGSLKEILARDFPDIAVLDPRGSALDGALLLANETNSFVGESCTSRKTII